jgi:hypothetical protein
VAHVRTGEARACAALVPVEGTIDTYSLHRSAYNASCACCGGGRWIRIASLNGGASRAGSLGKRTWRRLGSVGSDARLWTVGWSLLLVGSVDKVPDVSSAALGCDR